VEAKVFYAAIQAGMLHQVENITKNRKIN
jgi:hypothetical protein